MDQGIQKDTGNFERGLAYRRRGKNAKRSAEGNIVQVALKVVDKTIMEKAKLKS